MLARYRREIENNKEKPARTADSGHPFAEIGISRCRPDRPQGFRRAARSLNLAFFRGNKTSTRSWRLRGIQSALPNRHFRLAAIFKMVDTAVLQKALWEA